MIAVMRVFSSVMSAYRPRFGHVCCLCSHFSFVHSTPQPLYLANSASVVHGSHGWLSPFLRAKPSGHVIASIATTAQASASPVASQISLHAATLLRSCLPNAWLR